MRLHILASGSKGNASIVEDETTGRAFLIDCGICKRDLFTRSEELGVHLSQIEGIIISHEHSDHTKGLGVVLRGLGKLGIEPRLYASKAVAYASRDIASVCDPDAAPYELCDIEYFSVGSQLSVAGMSLYPFATSHDAAESFGFRVELKDTSAHTQALGYMTDTGYVPPAAFEMLSDCQLLALESNHDVDMLNSGPYPYSLKQRVASNRGHLSNTQASQALECLLSEKLEQVVAMHISENNNTYRLPREAFEGVIERNRHAAHTTCAFQNRSLSLSVSADGCSG